MDRLPVGVLHLGPDATILHANRAAGQLVGVDARTVVGRSILEFSAEPLERAAGLLSFGTEHRGTAMGPVPIRYRHADGSIRHGDMWAENHLDDPDVGAIVLALVPESSAAHVSAALTSVAEGASVDSTLALLAVSLRANPFVAAGCWLIRDADGPRLVGSDGLTEPIEFALRAPGSWWAALGRGVQAEVPDVDAQPDGHHRLLADAGVRAWWLQPLPREVTGVGQAGIIVVRSRPGAMSPNQAEQLGHIVTTAGLAFERTAMQERLSHAAFHDSLTGLANRERFFDRPTERLRPHSALLYVDLDDFKVVNDRHGHSAGDLVLVSIAERLRSSVRPGDRITRMGGDEFVVECAGLVDPDEAIAVAQRIIHAVQRPIVLDEVVLEVGASVGIALGASETSIESLLEQSDAALYAAKAAGRGRWHIAGSEDPVRTG